MEVSQIDPEKLMSLYSIVFQDVTLFDNTILENIRLGRKGATDEEVLAAAKLANCEEFAEKLPDKWNTNIGENGCALSGGERQRISIARAFLKDAPIILLDEATASLDVENETAIQEALSRLIKNKTVLIIAHRMRTVAGADQVVVLSGGIVAEQGSPAELYAGRDCTPTWWICSLQARTGRFENEGGFYKDSDKKLFDIVLVWKLDRFARNRYDSARYKTQLKRNGVKLVSATEVISAGPEGIILESVLEGYAEYYSADLSEKVVRGMTENALKGIYNGGTIPFGYMIDETRHYQPDPLLAPYVEQTFQKYADGATMTDLRDWLKAHNIKNSMGGEMSYNTIQRMLSNRRYIGELRLRDVVQTNAIRH